MIKVLEIPCGDGRLRLDVCGTLSASVNLNGYHQIALAKYSNDNTHRYCLLNRHIHIPRRSVNGLKCSKTEMAQIYAHDTDANKC